MGKPNPTSPRFKNMEEYQKWKADRLAQLARDAAEKPQSGPSAFCVRCGKQLPANSTYCDRCGVNQVTLARVPPVKQVSWFQRKGVPYGILAFVGLWALFEIHSVFAPKSTPVPPHPVSPFEMWHVTETRSPMDDSKEVVLLLDARDQIEGPLGMVRPSLVVRCKEKKTEVYVVTGMAASIEEDYDGGPKESHTARFRLDDNPPKEAEWAESTDHKALFAEDWVSGEGAGATSTSRIDFAKQIAGANTLTFQFTPFDGNPQVARFDVRGLGVHLHKVAEACGWIYE